MSAGAQSKVAATQTNTELAAAESKLAAAKTELVAAKTELAAAKTELAAAKTEEDKKRAQEYYDVVFAGLKTSQSAVDAAQALVNRLLNLTTTGQGAGIEEKLEALEAENKQMKEVLKRSAFVQKILDDPVNKLRGVASSGKSANPTARNFTKITLEEKCLFCNKNQNTGYAHIIPAGLEDAMKTDEALAARFNTNYTAPYDVRSGRNFLPMCGTHGGKNNRTCHHLFDEDKFILLPTLTDGTFSVIKLHPDADHLVDQVTLPYRPYMRGLAARAKLGFTKFQSDRSRVSIDFIFQIDFSECSSTRKEGTVTSASSKKAKTDVSTTS